METKNWQRVHKYGNVISDTTRKRQCPECSWK